MSASVSTAYEEGGFIGRIIKIVLALAVIGGAGAAGWYYFLRDEPAPTPVSTVTQATVTKGQLVTSLAASGTAQSTLTSRLTFSGSGTVKSVSVALGDKVTAGQELARIDDKDTRRKIETAASSLESAKLRLVQLQEPPTETNRITAQQATASARTQVTTAQGQVTSAQNQLVTARNNVVVAQNALTKAQQPAAAADIATADIAISNAETSLLTAQNNVPTTLATLEAAFKTYCALYTSLNSTSLPCSLNGIGSDVPLTDLAISRLQASIATGLAANVSTATTAILTADLQYKNALTGVTTAQKSLELAKTKRSALDAGADAATLEQLRFAITQAQAAVIAAETAITNAQTAVINAQTAVTAAEIKEAALGTISATDVALQQQSVNQAQISYQTVLDTLDGLVIKAPYDGTITAVGVVAGDPASASTAAFTITNQDKVRVDLTVSESDFRNIKLGQFGIAQFEAVPNQFYLVKVSAVPPQGTITQGVVTYTIQAQVLRATDLQANAAELQAMGQALFSVAGTAVAGLGVTGAGAGAGGFVPGAGGAGVIPGGTVGPGAGGLGAGGQGAGRGAFAGQTPPAGITPGAGRGAGLAGGGNLQALVTAPLPTTGMTASVVLVVSVTSDALLVPTTAIKRQGQRSYVLIPGADGSPVQTFITAGSSDNTNTAVTAGLNEGDTVLIGAVLPATAGASPATGGQTPAAGTGARATPAGGVR